MCFSFNESSRFGKPWLAGTCLVVVFCLHASSILAVDYVVERAKAVALARKRDYEKALTAFKALAEGEGISDFQKSDALLEAVSCALSLKNYDEAERLSELFPETAAKDFCRMRVLAARRKNDELIKRFKDVDFETWPDYLARQAWRLRGDAHYQLKNGAAAVADYRKTLEYPPEHVRYVADVKFKIGAARANLLNDDAKAIETYREIRGDGDKITGVDPCLAVIRIAMIRSKQGKLDEALRELAAIDLEASDPHHLIRPNTVKAYGDVLLAAGDLDAAEAKYREVMAMEKIPSYIKARSAKCLERIRETRGNGGANTGTVKKSVRRVSLDKDNDKDNDKITAKSHNDN